MKHGQRVKIKGYLKRVLSREKGETYAELKEWEFMPYDKPKKGILIGKRTLINGIVPYWEKNIFNPKEYFTAYLISLNLKENPIYITKEHIYIIN